MSFFKNFKLKIKSNYPNLVRFLIKMRDNNYFLRILKKPIFISASKKIHGKKIVKSERGILFDLSVDNFVSYTFRPKISKNSNFNEEVFDNSSTAIIIQGPMYGLKNFVKETLLFYTKIFENVPIILSTWEDECKKDFFDEFDKYNNIKIIKNIKPQSTFNVDFQTLSTNEALSFAKSKNISYCLKTRTDTRIYKKNSIFFLKNLLKNFPIKEKYNALKNRIITCSIDTRKYRVYGLSDILLFSSTDNLIKYFEKKDFISSLKDMGLGRYPCLKNDVAVINEIFLCARFLKTNNIEIDWTLEDWWNKCREIFCIVDSNFLDFFWYKYEWKYEQRFNINYTSNYEQSMQFTDWLNLYQNPNLMFKNKFKEKWKIKDGIIVQ